MSIIFPAEGNRNGEVKWFYGNGQILEKAMYADSNIVGNDSCFYDEGTTQLVTPYTNGIKNGEAKRFYLNGHLKETCTYAEDKLTGNDKCYYADGKEEKDTPYKNGERNGEEKWYYESGQLMEDINYVNDKVIGISKSYYENGKLKKELPYVNGLISGTIKEYYENSKIKKTVDFNNDGPDGNVISFWQNGKQQRNDKYEKGKFKEGKCFDSTGTEIPFFAQAIEAPSDLIYTLVQQKPEFPGDLYGYLSGNIKYPEEERNKNITGTVYLTFVVEKDGSVNQVEVLRGVPNGPGLDAEAVRCVSSMPKWSPGLQNGLAVRVQYNIPIHFSLR